MSTVNQCSVLFQTQGRQQGPMQQSYNKRPMGCETQLALKCVRVILGILTSKVGQADPVIRLH